MKEKHRTLIIPGPSVEMTRGVHLLSSACLVPVSKYGIGPGLCSLLSSLNFVYSGHVQFPG